MHGATTVEGGSTIELTSPTETDIGGGSSMGLAIKMQHCTLSRRDERRSIVVFHLPWPDFGVLPGGFLAWCIDQVQARRGTGPMAVHCFAGRGRTGTFALACALSRAAGESGAPTSLYGQGLDALLRLRCHRSGLVETPEQFASVFEILPHPNRAPHGVGQVGPGQLVSTLKQPDAP